jgi:hypothetical protein
MTHHRVTVHSIGWHSAPVNYACIVWLRYANVEYVTACIVERRHGAVARYPLSLFEGGHTNRYVHRVYCVLVVRLYALVSLRVVSYSSACTHAVQLLLDYSLVALRCEFRLRVIRRKPARFNSWWHLRGAVGRQSIRRRVADCSTC